MSKTNFIDPDLSAPDYSTKFCRMYYNLLSRKYNKDMFYEVCHEIGIPPTFLLEDGNWVSNKFLSTFLEKIKEKTGNQNIAEEAGETLLDTDNINPFESALLKAASPTLFYFLLPLNAKKVNRRSFYKVLNYRPGKIKIALESDPKKQHSPDICLNAAGVLKSVQKFYNLDQVKVTHQTCIHRGDSSCVFDIEYSSNKFVWKLIGAIASSMLVYNGINYFTNFISTAYPTLSTINTLIWITFISVLTLSVFAVRMFNVIRYNFIHHEQSRSKELVLYENRIKLDRRYKEANLLRELSLNLIQETNAKNVINLCLNELTDKFNYKRAIVMLYDSNQGKLITADVRGFEKYNEILYKLTLKYPSEKGSPQLFANVLDRGHMESIEDIDAYKKDLNPENQILISALGLNSLIISPIQDHNYKYGLLVIGRIASEPSFSSEDAHLIENVTNILALFFQNAKNFEKERALRSVFQKYVPSIVMDNLRTLESGENSIVLPKNNAITSMFVDLRGFTSISQSLDPSRVFEMLNIYIDHITDKIAEYGGIIDNLIGDGVVGFFPATPEHRTLHAKQALMCSIDIIGNLDSLNAKLKEKGFGAVKLGIGLHSGSATIGNVGGRIRMNYTAIGDTVNVASRLENLCKEFVNKFESTTDGLIIFSDAVQKRAGLKAKTKFVKSMNIRGRQDPMNIHLIDQSQAKELTKLEAHEMFVKRKKESGLAELGERRLTRKKTKKVS